MENIGGKIRKLRELRGYSQEYLASRMGVSQRAYSKIETSETKINWEKLVKIANILEMEPMDIASFDDNLIFNNCSLSGKFEHFINQIPEKLIEQYEQRIIHLEDEIKFLKRQIENK